MRVAFAVDRAARATLVVARLKRGGVKRLGKVSAQVQPPRARIDIAKVGGKVLKPGRYRVTITLPGVRPGVATVRVR